MPPLLPAVLQCSRGGPRRRRDIPVAVRNLSSWRASYAHARPDAVVVGASGVDLHFASVDLDGTPKPGGTYVHEGANQGETRSHGFFYRPSSPTTGTLGLPVRKGGSSTGHQLTGGSAEILYLDVNHLAFSKLGTLGASAKAARADRCKVSCVDWYGNARPIFLGDRVLALLGDELVEGQREDGALRETRRANMLDALR